MGDKSIAPFRMVAKWVGARETRALHPSAWLLSGWVERQEHCTVCTFRMVAKWVGARETRALHPSGWLISGWVLERQEHGTLPHGACSVHPSVCVMLGSHRLLVGRTFSVRIRIRTRIRIRIRSRIRIRIRIRMRIRIRVRVRVRILE
jgi:hypothetical protein